VLKNKIKKTIKTFVISGQKSKFEN